MQLPQTATEAIGCHQLCFGSAESLRKGRANKKLNLSTNLSKYLPGLHLSPSFPFPLEATPAPAPFPLMQLKPEAVYFYFASFCGVSKEFNIKQVQGAHRERNQRWLSGVIRTLFTTMPSNILMISKAFKVTFKRVRKYAIVLNTNENTFIKA